MAVNENEQDRVGAEAAQAAEKADEQGLLFTDDVSPLPSDTGYRGPDRLQRRRHHLPPARLLGPHRPRGAHRPRRLRLRHAAALLLPRHPDPQGRQAPARRRDLAAADPHRGRPPARARHRRPDPRHLDERRRQRLRVHQQRRGHRPPPGRPGRLRHRHRRRVARDRGHPRRAAQRAHRRGGARRPATSWPLAGPPARPAERTTTGTTTGPEQTLRARRTSSGRRVSAGASPGERRQAAACRCPASIAAASPCPARVATRNPEKNASPAPLVSTTSVTGRDGHVQLLGRRHRGRPARPLGADDQRRAGGDPGAHEGQRVRHPVVVEEQHVGRRPPSRGGRRPSRRSRGRRTTPAGRRRGRARAAGGSARRGRRRRRRRWRAPPRGRVVPGAGPAVGQAQVDRHPAARGRP